MNKWYINSFNILVFEKIEGSYKLMKITFEIICLQL